MAEIDLFDTSRLEGDGTAEMVVFERDGSVIMRFHEPREWVKFDRDNAALVGKEIIDVAVEAGAVVEIKVPKRPITEEDRTKLIYRVDNIMRSMQEQNKRPMDIARSIVDSVLSEID